MSLPVSAAGTSLATALALLLVGCGDRGPAPGNASTDAAPAAPPISTAAAPAQTSATPASPSPAPASTGVIDPQQLSDFSGAALDEARQRARQPDAALESAARVAMDAAATQRECAGIEEPRVLALDLDGAPGDEALALYTAYGCYGMDNYFERNGIVLRQEGAAWAPVAEFALGTRMVGGARISALEPGVVVVTPDEGSDATGGSTEIPAR